MKPDGDDTATMEPMEALNAGPAIEVAPVGEAQDQALPSMQTEGEPQTTEALSATNKTGKDKPANSKAMAKAPVKTKAPTTGTKVSTTSSRPTTGQSRLTNGTQKPQTNGVTKKTTTGGLEKKSTSTTAASKKTTVTAPTTKVAEKKPMGTARPPSASTNGVKTTGTAQPIKKAPTAPANGLKSKPKTTAPAPRPASASTTKPSTTDSPKPVSKTTRPAGSASTARSSPATPKLATPTTAGKTSTSASRPTTATPKTPTTTAKPSPAKTTAPPAGRTPTQTPKTTTPVKKDASKQSSTPAAKKPSASPLTRPAAAKTTKPDTPKSATTAKPELSSKKPTTPSKTADPKTSKPKESKATPSKEVSASHKTTGSKTSTKTSSPKKAVGSSTPMPVKRGPKATQPADAADTEGEKDDVATTVAVAAAATVAATAAAAVATMVTSEETHEGSATPVLSAASEGSHEDLHTPDIPAASEVKFEDSFTSHSPPASMERFEETVQPVISPAFEDASEDKVLPVIPPTFDEIPNETLTPVIPPLSEDAIEDTDTPVILPTFNQAPEESVTSVIPSAFDKAFENKVIPDIPPASEEVSEDKVTPVIPPASEEVSEDKVIPVIPPASEEVPEDKVIPVIPPASEEVPKDKVAPVIHPTFEEAPEEMVTPVISPTSEEVELVYPQDPQSMDFYKDDNAMSQLAAQVDLVSLEEPVPTVSPLGTTVLSPPSSPTGPVSMPETLQSSAPFLGLQGPAEPWAQSTSLFPSTATPETHEQDEETVLDDIQRSSSTAEKLMGDFDLLSSTSADHFRSIAPVSTCQEREEAVEKAEEEINEDIHDDEEEEEEEDDEEEEEEKDEVREIAIEQAMPHKELEDDFTKGVADFGSSDWGMTLSDDMHSGYKLDEVVTSPFNAEKTCSAKGDFFMSEAEREQPFIGPPGIESFSEEEDEEEDEDKEEEHQKEDMDVDSEHGEHHTQQKEVEEKEENVEIVSGGMAENELDVCVNDDDVVDDDDVGGEGYTEEGHLGLHYMSQTAPTQSMTMTETWSHSSPFSDPWAQPASILSESSLLDMRAADSDTHTNLSTDPDTTTKFSAEPDTPPKSPSGSFLEISPPIIQASEAQHGIPEETESSVQAESGILVAPAIAMSQSSTFSGTALAAHSSSETSTPEELQDYDSSSGVESRSDKLQTPVPTMQTDMEQDLGIHLERGDGEEEEAETLPADEVLGDAATAPASVPSSPSTSGDEASDTEGEMLINDTDIAADESTTVSHNLAALEEDEEAPEHIGEEDGDTPHSANSVASYGFDCSASNSNAHSTAESCGKSPGIFSLENEEQLPEEAKDPFFIKELTLPAASAYSDELLGCPVDLLPVSEPKESNAGFDEHYMLCRKTDPSAMEEVDPESPMHLSPQHGDDSDGQPPYYSAICDKTDNFLAGNV